MKKLVLFAALLLPFTAGAATPTQDTALNVSLAPNSKYNVTANVSTNDASALLALLTGGESPLQLLDDTGNVIGEIPAQDVIDLFTGLTGAATREVDTVIQTGAGTVDNLTARTLNTPDITIGNIQVRAVSAANQPPTVTIKSKKKVGNFLRLRGTASDDQQVAYVEVIANGRVRRAHGTTAWNSHIALKEGANRIVVRAFDNTGTSSAKSRLKARN